VGLLVTVFLIYESPARNVLCIFNKLEGCPCGVNAPRRCSSIAFGTFPGEGTGYRTPASGSHFPLFTAVFSKGWVLRHSSAQLKCSIISVFYETSDWATFRNLAWWAKAT
jgi:hypothetical protein